ncbi:MAG: DUF4417 domain-containing protein [Bacteroidaceae bacterium]|nr:DUF4417 domain-containing protein [Bacteroidaceae bacterium]
MKQTKNFIQNIRHLNLHLCEDVKFSDNQLPEIVPIYEIPNKLISYKDCRKTNDYNGFVHFYIDDIHFERIWSHPEESLSLLQKYDGVIMPDYSIYWDAPMPVQHWNLYRSRLIGSYWQQNGIKVIPTIPFSTFDFNKYSLTGLAKGSFVSVSNVGSRKDHFRRTCFQQGLNSLIYNLEPKAIIVYGDIDSFNFHGIKTYCYKPNVFKYNERKK